MKRLKAVLVGFFALSLIFAGFLGAGTVEAQGKRLKVAAIYSTPIEEPWIQVIHRAYEKIKGKFNLDYEYTEKVSAADYERVVREYIARGFDVISGESFINEGAARRVAKEFPKVRFLMGSGLGPAEPNFAVFDNWLPTRVTTVEAAWGEKPSLTVGDVGQATLDPLKDPTGQATKVTGAAAQAGFQFVGMDLASSIGSCWTDPDFQSWEGDSGTLHVFDWIA